MFIGSKTELWNKVMKEVKLKRYTGPFNKIPYECYIQSPIGLVPKDNGKKTRLIFHLSYPRDAKDGRKSVNACSPREACTVQYASFDEAIALCMQCLQSDGTCEIVKSDMDAAFRNLGIRKDHWHWLIMKAESPIDGKTYFFVDKCLPFRASISCAHFQAVSDAMAHIVKFFTRKPLVNYLDNYLFTAISKM